MINILIDLAFIFVFSMTTLFALRKFARYIGLVDKPNERKFHKGTIPLVGGLSICLSILYFLYNNPEMLPYSHIYALCMTILVAVGVADDRWDISFRLRLLVQAGLALLMIHFAGALLTNLGNMFGFGEVLLPSAIAQIITIFAVIGAINAFNMVDGIDGLLGGLASVTFAALGVIFYLHGEANLAYLCAVFIVAMLPYILFNLGAFGRTRKVFMGDAGSMLIGFTVIWLLLLASQSATGDASEQTAMRAVTALWIIGLPLNDMAAIMIRRIRRGDSPFKPDREHLHHICQRLGLNPTQTLLAICFMASLFAVIGIYGELANIAAPIMFYGFILTFVIYTLLLSNIWKITTKIRSYSKLKRIKKIRYKKVNSIL